MRHRLFFVIVILTLSRCLAQDLGGVFPGVDFPEGVEIGGGLDTLKEVYPSLRPMGGDAAPGDGIYFDSSKGLYASEVISFGIKDGIVSRIY